MIFPIIYTCMYICTYIYVYECIKMIRNLSVIGRG